MVSENTEAKSYWDNRYLATVSSNIFCLQLENFGYNLLADESPEDGDEGSGDDDSPIEILDDDDSVETEEQLPDLPSGEYSLPTYTLRPL